MEDGPNDASQPKTPEATENGVASPPMAGSPLPTADTSPERKTNGEVRPKNDDFSSESDALVIDESVPVKKKRKRLLPKKLEQEEVHFNPYFNESLFELSQQAQPKKKPSAKKSKKLREYAQYLGLQPTVQFKCWRCGRAGFESLGAVNEHAAGCTDAPAAPQRPEHASSSFKLTRKVFLCSACGTYYENCNLYVHMLQVHRRYLCLYCLGMFSALDDLCAHIQHRHNLQPGRRDTVDDFFSVYKDPCYIVCCECSQIFNEQENFFHHTCNKKIASNKVVRFNSKLGIKSSASKKAKVRLDDHVTGDNKASEMKEAGDKACVSDEIVYSSDDELNFVGFRNGEPVFLDKVKAVKLSDIGTEKEVQEVEEDEEEEEVEEEEEAALEEDAQPSEYVPEVVEAMEEPPVEPPVETRKVPKLSLKLNRGSFPQITSEKSHDDNDDDEEEEENEDEEENTSLEKPQNEQIESENEPDDETTKITTTTTPTTTTITTTNNNTENIEEEEEETDETETPIVDETKPQIKIAGDEITIIELNELEQPLDKFDICVLLQKCLKTTAPTCIYCNHARKIAVNGKQLGLHAIAEHRFSGVVSSITAEELIPESFVNRIRESLEELNGLYLNLEASAGDEAVTFAHSFECFQCRYSSPVHKELYVHNRKLHAKNLLLCIMCKLNFYSYSELICHLCPGEYIDDYDVSFRCCMCVSDSLPSAFRLMVHLRKRHHVCDVCLEMCHNQYKLSNHVWKHKLNHFCYRCGIAYRNKPDITRHLFWKHGTESVMCKKCLQKKWPHVYHFCMPPTSFQCEECTLTFSRAVALKVHKRIHANDKPHACTVDECTETFVSRKLLAKHERKHREPPEPPQPIEEEIEVVIDDDVKKNEEIEKVEEEKVKPKVDVYDLPALNLSESDSSDSDDEATTKKGAANVEEMPKSEQIVAEEKMAEKAPEKTADESVVLEIWDNFKNYQASKEKFDNLLDKEIEVEEILIAPMTAEMALMDHDYCIDPEKPKPDVTFTEVKPDLSQSVDHDYCFAKKDKSDEKEAKKAEKKATSSSDSSSDSSSSCSCGPNCSCSSSSGSSSSDSDSSNSDSSTAEGRKRQQLRREKRRQKKQEKSGKVKPTPSVEIKATPVVTVANNNVAFPEMPIQESDLSTNESDTDEEFYDKQPHLLAKKLIEEKRNAILAGIEENGLGGSRAGTPNMPEMEETVKIKKKSKSKKKKKRKSERREMEARRLNAIQANNYYQYYQPQTVAPLTLSLTRNSPIASPSAAKTPTFKSGEKSDENDSLRASKRRRVPNKFYGYSSDEEEGKAPKWRKMEAPVMQFAPPALTVPPITIKTVQRPPTPTVAPISIRTPARVPPFKLKTNLAPKVEAAEEPESEEESNGSSNEGRNTLQVNPNALYCYCKCPYDEVSEMIGCDSRDCSIEWFHFECVGIMVPPKGHWYCPECRKKRQQKREMLKAKSKTATAAMCHE